MFSSLFSKKSTLDLFKTHTMSASAPVECFKLQDDQGMTYAFSFPKNVQLDGDYMIAFTKNDTKAVLNSIFGEYARTIARLVVG
jgi:hypothetical protein